MSAILKTSIAFRGDVDTVTAIACGAASFSRDVVQDLPQVLYDNLENGPYGRDYLRQVDAQIAALVQANKTER
ncbi:MAG: hypothetical protein KGS72_04515 [Cyanobacteria bacterium REEB67]|nr:hypothetical protein [Cyanobacteria bacterium REEB67]